LQTIVVYTFLFIDSLWSKGKNKITSATAVLRAAPQLVLLTEKQKNVNNLKVNRRIIPKYTMRALPDSGGGMTC